jgi:hypothetical protein
MRIFPAICHALWTFYPASLPLIARFPPYHAISPQIEQPFATLAAFRKTGMNGWLTRRLAPAYGAVLHNQQLALADCLRFISLLLFTSG